jgi:hypothetical protein
MTEFKTPNKKNNRFEQVWNLRPARSWLAMAGGFICNLVLGICDFLTQNSKAEPENSDLALRGVGSTSRSPKGPGFL